MMKHIMLTVFFPRCKVRKVTAGFDGNEITLEGDGLLL